MGTPSSFSLFFFARSLTETRMEINSGASCRLGQDARYRRRVYSFLNSVKQCTAPTYCYACRLTSPVNSIWTNYMEAASSSGDRNQHGTGRWCNPSLDVRLRYIILYSRIFVW